MIKDTSMPDSILTYLVCPLCKGTLRSASANQVVCMSCKSEYPMDDGIPILLPSNLDKFKMLDAEFHSNAADEFAERNMRFSYRVSRYHEDYLSCFFKCQNSAVILEVGCGGGLEAVRLKNMGITVIASDIAIGMVKTARKRVNDDGQTSHTIFVVCDAEQLPCQDHSLDGVLIVGSLHHLPAPERFIAAAKRALKPGGMLVIGFEPNRWPYYTVYPTLRFFGRLLHPRRCIAPGEASVGDMETTGFDADDFDRFLKAGGLEKVSLQRIWYINGFIQTALAYINRERPVARLLDLPSASQRALVACDDFLSRIPILRDFCWHWTLIAKRPQEHHGD
ncbi:MAG: hypothetical protein C0399_09345 [Syntrophus sp. (in: bacteria)]|nr:hypothetical protein [Syntrophus sp. (in: bacteria)]